MIDKLKVPKAIQPIFNTVASIIDEFCQKNLKDEYSQVSRNFGGILNAEIEWRNYERRAHQLHH